MNRGFYQLHVGIGVNTKDNASLAQYLYPYKNLIGKYTSNIPDTEMYPIRLDVKIQAVAARVDGFYRAVGVINGRTETVIRIPAGRYNPVFTGVKIDYDLRTFLKISNRTGNLVEEMHGGSPHYHGLILDIVKDFSGVFINAFHRPPADE